MTDQTAREARKRAMAAAVDLAEAWAEFWAAVDELGEATAKERR